MARFKLSRNINWPNQTVIVFDSNMQSSGLSGYFFNF